MKEKLFALTVSSPEELAGNRSLFREKRKNKCLFVALAISGSQVLVRTFDLPKAPFPDIINNLKFDAVELLSLPVDEIELDFQVLSSTKEKVSGVFACLPKKLLADYLSILDKEKITPVKITAYILAHIDAFLLSHTTNNKRFCLLDFSKRDIIHLAVFNQKQCELLREIPYENLEEARLEVIQSLRSACGKSHAKQFDHIYFSGDLAQSEQLASEIGRDFSSATEHIPFIDIKTALCHESNFFDLNLLSKYSFFLSGRKKILKITNILLWLCFFICLLLTWEIQKTEKLINILKSSYSASDYDYARNLKNQLRSLK